MPEAATHRPDYVHHVCRIQGPQIIQVGLRMYGGRSNFQVQPWLRMATGTHKARSGRWLSVSVYRLSQVSCRHRFHANDKSPSTEEERRAALRLKQQELRKGLGIYVSSPLAPAGQIVSSLLVNLSEDQMQDKHQSSAQASRVTTASLPGSVPPTAKHHHHFSSWSISDAEAEPPQRSKFHSLAHCSVC